MSVPFQNLRQVLWMIGLGLLTLVSSVSSSWAGAFEFSLGLYYNRSNYSNDSYNWSRRWGSSLGYRFTELSQVEFSFSDTMDRTKITNYEDTTFHDQVYSLNWVQSLMNKNQPVQPYVKVGVGQLNRRATGNYAGGASPPSEVDSVTVVLGGGLRIYLTHTFAIRSEFTSYLTGGALSTWKDNIGATIGLSLYF